MHVALRELRPEDAPAVHRWFNTPAATDGLVELRDSFSEEDARQWVERAVAADGPDRKWAVTTAGHGEPVGFTALYGLGRQTAPELGILIGDTTAWGQGVGTAAQRLTIARAFEEFGAHRVVELILADNLRARRVVEQLGFVLEGVMRAHVRRGDELLDVVVYGLLPEDFNA